MGIANWFTLVVDEIKAKKISQKEGLAIIDNFVKYFIETEA